jgi:heterodisulfide reductase subunit B
LKLECCGAPLLGINDDLSMELTRKKLSDGKRSGADYMCTACPWCQLQFDLAQTMMPSRNSNNHHLPPIIYPQLLGLVMGLDADTLGIKENRIDISDIQNHLTNQRSPAELGA